MIAKSLSQVNQKVVVLCDHPVNLIVNGEPVTFPTSGQVARRMDWVEWKGDVATGALAGVPVVYRYPGHVQGLPEPEEGTIYIVAGVIIEELLGSGRTDVFCPDGRAYTWLDGKKYYKRLVAVRPR